MKPPLTIDPQRLARLKEQRNTARRAHSEIQEQILELHRQRSQIDADARRFQENLQQNRLIVERSDRDKQRREDADRVKALTTEIDDLRRRAEPLSERSNALGRLYRNCAEFLGVNPNV